MNGAKGCMKGEIFFRHVYRCYDLTVLKGEKAKQEVRINKRHGLPLFQAFL